MYCNDGVLSIENIYIIQGNKHNEILEQYKKIKNRKGDAANRVWIALKVAQKKFTSAKRSVGSDERVYLARGALAMWCDPKEL